jgi:hypothetical protein
MDRWTGRDVTTFTESEMAEFINDCQAVETPEQKLVGALYDVIANKNSDPGPYDALQSILG